MRRTLVAYLLLAYGLSACAATKAYDPFKIAHADIRGRVKVVALVPIELSTDAEDPAAVKAKFEWLIRSKLEEGGFKVIPSDEFASIWKKTVEKLGPVYDPATGRRDEKKFEWLIRSKLEEGGFKVIPSDEFGSN